jgi:cardiolipin synthase
MPNWRFALRTIIFFVASVLSLSGCASLPDYQRLRRTDTSQTQPVVIGQEGMLSPARTEQILRDLQQQGKSSLLDRHLAFMQAINSIPLVVGNAVRLLIDGPSTYDAMFDAIASAHDHVNLETYIMEADAIGEKFAAALIEKRAQGVQVNLMYDGVGARGTPKEFFGRLGAHGIKVCEFNPVNPLKGRLFRLNNRDHRKILVVDGKIGFTGGVNISRVYSSSIFKNRGAGPEFAWRDTHIEVRGPAVKDFQRIFFSNWSKQKCPAPAPGDYFPELKAQGDTVVQTIASSPETKLNMIYLGLLSAISHAERSIDITMAYFLPDAQTIDALRQAVRRGVKIRLLLPGFSDSWFTFYAGRAHYEELLRAGVRIYERRDALLHAKTVVIDGVWSTVGSSNMDLRSFLHNDEMNVVVLGSEFGRQMHDMFQADLARSVPVDLTKWEKRGTLERLKENLARMWEYWL